MPRHRQPALSVAEHEHEHEHEDDRWAAERERVFQCRDPIPLTLPSRPIPGIRVEGRPHVLRQHVQPLAPHRPDDLGV